MKQSTIFGVLVVGGMVLYPAHLRAGSVWDKIGKGFTDAYNTVAKGGEQAVNFVKGNTADIAKTTHTFEHAIINRWVTLPDYMPLDKAVFLGSHNSFAHGSLFTYRQQIISVDQQIRYGVRAFMQDIHLHPGKPRDKNVYLCHNKCDGPVSLAMTGSPNPPYEKFSNSLAYMEQWLNSNPQEIIFIFLENYTENKADLANDPDDFATDRAIERGIKNKNILVTDADWKTFGFSEGEVVTMGMLRAQNKRLFIFNENQTTKWTMNQWDRVIENNFSTTDPQRICGERSSSANYKDTYRPLFLMNYFREITATHNESVALHTKSHMQTRINNCNFPQYPNFIFIDQVQSLIDIKKKGQGDLMDLINERNADVAQVALEHEKIRRMPLFTVDPTDLNAVRALLEAGEQANVNDGRTTPLLRVVKAHTSKDGNDVAKFCNIIRLFLQKGATTDFKDITGKNAYMYARERYGMHSSFGGFQLEQQMYPFIDWLYAGQVRSGGCPRW